MKSANLRLLQKLKQKRLPQPEPDLTGMTSMEQINWKAEQLGLAGMIAEAREMSAGKRTLREVVAAIDARDEAILAARAADAAAGRLAQYPGSAAAQINARATREAAERLAKIAEEAERVAEEAKLRPPPLEDEPEAEATVAEEPAEPAATEEAPPAPAVPQPLPPPEPKPEPQWWEEKAQWRERGLADHYADDAVYECEHEYDPLADEDDDRDEVVEY